MEQKEFLITGGFFDNSSEGYIGKIRLVKKGKEVTLAYETLLITEPPTPDLRIKNKGFAGGSIHKNLLWLCSANQVLAYSLSKFKLKKVIDDPLFNDLHHVLACNQGLYVVNTGLESLDFFGYDGKLKTRNFLTSKERNELRISSADDFRTTESKPHFMHANYCSLKPNGEVLLTFVRQRRVVNTVDWSWASPEYPAPPHEGFISKYSVTNQNLLWATTVAGDIIATDPISGKIIEQWHSKNYGISTGWTRGLFILEHGFLLGTTLIRKSNAEYYSRWSDEDTKDSQTTISYIPFDKSLTSVSVQVEENRPAKVFSIIPTS